MIYGNALESALSSSMVVYIHKPNLDLALKDSYAVGLAYASVIFVNFTYTHKHTYMLMILIDLW